MKGDFFLLSFFIISAENSRNDTSTQGLKGVKVREKTEFRVDEEMNGIQEDKKWH